MNKQLKIKHALQDLLNGRITKKEFKKICLTPISTVAYKDQNGKIVYQSLIGERKVSLEVFKERVSDFLKDEEESPVFILDDVRID